MSETWVLNEDIYDTLTKQNINFVSNGGTFDSIECESYRQEMSPISFYRVYYGSYIVYDGGYGYWQNNDGYKTITFDTAPTGDLLTWLQANGTKQATEPTFSFRHLHNISTIGSGSVKFKVYAPYQPPQLATPTNVSASGTTVSWSAVTNATSYEVFADGTSIATTANVSYNLTNSAGWANLPDGNHNITIVAKADGYRDSAKSTSVTVTKGGSTGETWVLNEEPHFSPLVDTTEFEVPFSINSVTYSVLRFESELVPMHTDAVNISVSSASIVQTSIYYSGSWVNEAYRTVTFETAPTGGLLTWLQENATKQ